MAHPRVLKRSDGTRQVQISWGKVGGKRKVEYVGSGRTDEEVELLLVEARERLGLDPCGCRRPSNLLLSFFSS